MLPPLPRDTSRIEWIEQSPWWPILAYGPIIAIVLASILAVLVVPRLVGEAAAPLAFNLTWSAPILVLALLVLYVPSATRVGITSAGVAIGRGFATRVIPWERLRGFSNGELHHGLGSNNNRLRVTPAQAARITKEYWARQPDHPPPPPSPRA